MKFLAFFTLLFFLYASTLALALNYGEASVEAKKMNKKGVLNREGEPKQSLRIKKNELMSKINKTSQIWSKNETPYLKNHVVHLRHNKSANTLQANSISNFKRKQQSFYRQLTDDGNHEFATVSYDEPSGVYGVKAIVNYWNPRIEMGARNKEYSSGYIRIRSGPNNDFDVLEAGWHVFPWFYTEEGDTAEDDKTRFYIFWTNDSRNGHTCYNEEYPGFTSESNIQPGSEFRPTSVYGGEQKEMTLAIWKDNQQKKWKLKYNNRVVGHWSENLFTHLRTRGTRVEWGGEVYNSNNGGRFTSTEMGSGHFANQGYGRASYFKRLKVKTSGSGGNWMTPERQRLEVFMTSPRHYNLQFQNSIGTPAHDGFFYGGPGRNNNNP